MKATIRTIALIAFAAALAGCSSFKVGGFCYLPHGTGGQCQVMAVPPAK